MGNLNAEAVKKALECCLNDECISCPYDDVGVYSQCVPTLLENALSLIKKLTEENERLKSVEFTCGFVKPHKVLECPIFDEIERAKADTVRQMQEELKKTFFALCKGEMGDLYRIIDQIAKEMLEGENEN